MKIKIKSDLANFQRCQQFIRTYNQSKGSIPHKQIHKFIGRFDRGSVRNVANFKPLQQIMKQLIPKLLSDKFICSNSHMMSNLTSVFGNLNLYSKQLMDHSSVNMVRIIKQSKENNIEHLINVYRAFVELNQHNHQPFLVVLRQQIKENILKQLQQIIQERTYKNPHFFLKNFQMVHRYLRSMLLDPNLHAQSLQQIFSQFEIIFKSIGEGQLKTQQHFRYHNSAVVYQYIKVFKIPVKEGFYFNFLRSIYEKRRKQKENEKINMHKQAQQLERKGQSVFENRFQKNLHLSGYWFQNNIKIGLNEYDVLVKGMRRQQFIPFRNVNLDKLKSGKFTQVTPLERKQFQSMNGLWYIDEKKKLKQDLVINLNGPYHYIQGEKSGLVRSQAIKQSLLKYYGYSNYLAIDYRVWQRQTNNQRSIKTFFQNTIIF